MRRRQFLSALAMTSAARGEWLWSAPFRRLYNLDYDAAIEGLERMPDFADNAELQNQYAYALLYRALFRADALDSAAALNVSSYLKKPKVPMPAEERKRCEGAVRRARELAEAALAKDPQNALAMYEIGVGAVQRSNLSFLVDKDWTTALKTSGEARKLHREAYRLDLRLVDALLIPSVYDFIVGSLPVYIKALGFLAGIHGDKNRGIDGMRQVASTGRRAQIEGQILLVYAERREEHPERVVDIVRRLVAEFPENHLYRMELVNTLLEMKQREEAKKEMAALEEKRYRFLKPERLALFHQEFEKAKR